MQSAMKHALNSTWLTLGIYWLWSSWRVKVTSNAESLPKRLVAYYIPLLVAGALLGPGEWYGDSWLHGRFLAEFPGLDALGLALVVAGVGIACWARYTLGRNWSVAAELKHGHELVRAGPYRRVRHPIYSGLSSAFLGTAVMIGEWRALIAFLAVFVSFVYKLRVEERMLRGRFGERYVDYCRNTSALIPAIY